MSTDFIKENMPEEQAVEAGCQWSTIAQVPPMLTGAEKF
jgi:hypothetical protein